MLNLFYNDSIQTDLSKIDHSATTGEGSTEGSAFKVNLKAAQEGVTEQGNRLVGAEAEETNTSDINVSESDINSDSLPSVKEQSFDALSIDASFIDASTLDTQAPHAQFSVLAESMEGDVASKALLQSAILNGESEIDQSELSLINERLSTNDSETSTLSGQIRLPAEIVESEGAETAIPFANVNSANPSIIDKVLRTDQTGRRALAKISGNNLPPLQHSATNPIEASEQVQADSEIDTDGNNASSKRFIPSPELTTKSRLFSSLNQADNSATDPITPSVSSDSTKPATPIRSMTGLEIGLDGEIKMNNDFMGQKGKFDQSITDWFSQEQTRNSNRMTTNPEALLSGTFEDPTLINATAAPNRANGANPTLNPQLHNESTLTQVYTRHQAGTEQWRNEITTQVNWLKGRNVNSAEIHLHPAELGSIEIKIATEDDRTIVSIVTANQLTKEVIEESLPRLKELFTASGLTLDETNVSHNKQNETESSKDNETLLSSSERDDKDSENNNENDGAIININRMNASTTYIDHYA